MTARGRRSRLITATALVLLLAPACQTPGSEEPVATPEPAATSGGEVTLDSSVAALEERLEVYDDVLTGAIVLVRVGDDTEVVVSGTAERREGQGMTAELTWPVASLTKMMTATVVVQLVDEGRLALGDPARRWLPELRGVREPITVGQLLAHRSGLQDTGDADVRRAGFATSALVRAAAGHPLQFEPGSSGSYANVGYGALQLLVERVLDRPLGDVLRDRVFLPSEMTSSSLRGSPDVQGYDERGRPVGEYYLQVLPAAGSVVSTVADVDRFLQALSSGVLVPPERFEEMHERQGYVGIWSDYGLGLAMESFACGTAWGHGGRLDGFSSEAWTLDDAERSVVVVVNDTGSRFVRNLAEIALCG